MRGFFVLLVVAIVLSNVGSKLNDFHWSHSSVSDLLTESDPPPGFAYALEPRAFSFPQDHGAHSNFRSEWWYFTGNLTDEDERRFGFQLTLFRFALVAQLRESPSPWRKSDVYMGHFAISDVATGEFHSFERHSRSALGLAGADHEPTKIWIKDWSLELDESNTESWILRARQDNIALALDLHARRPITLQGERGLSKKNELPGNASYYYSIPRLAAIGTISTVDAVYKVSGEAWFDHEWGTSALAPGQRGWDWFSLQLDNDVEVMFYRIRDASGRADTASHGVVLRLGKAPATLLADDVSLEVQRYWRSPVSGARYPANWKIVIPKHRLELIVTPQFSDQEWRKSFTYWEGSVAINGHSAGLPVNGSGYVELVGYE